MPSTLQRLFRSSWIRPGAHSRGLRAVVPFAAALLGVAAAPAQAAVLTLPTNDEVQLRAAIQAANALAFQTSAANPVVIELAHPSVGGTTITLSQALPILVVDHVIVRVAGAGPATRVTVDAANASIAFRIASHDAVVRNLRFRKMPVAGTQEDAFTAFGTDSLSLIDCDFEGATGNALWLIGASSTTVTGCGFTGSSAGLVATSGSSGIAVAGCSFANNALGVLLAVAQDVAITGSTFTANGLAMSLQPICADVTFGPGNEVRTSTAQPALTAAGAVRLDVRSNLFADNQRGAMALVDFCADVTVADTVVERNGLTNNAFQILVADSQDVRLHGITCRDGRAGITAARSTRVEVARSPSASTVITGHTREALVLQDCSDVVVDRLGASGNLTAVASAQVAVLGGTDIDLLGLQIGAAAGAGRIGLRIDGASGVRVGAGSEVLDNGGQGILVGDAADVILGTWPGATGALTVRGPSPLQLVDCIGVVVAGTAAAPCTLRAGVTPTSVAASVSGGLGYRFGPHLFVDGNGAANAALQIADAAAARLDGVDVFGHTQRGLIATRAPGLLVQNCSVDGGTGGGTAAGEGILINPDCHGATVSGTLVRRQQVAAFKVVDCDDVELGPGNRAIDNAGDGFVVSATGSGPPTRRARIRSAIAVGRGLAGQSGFRCIRTLASLVNVTATAHGTGVLLQAQSNATIVNTIAWGNGVDRNREAASSGAWWNGLYGTTAGVIGPGAWTQQATLVAVNPQFVSPATGNVALQAGSPAIDSGLHATPIGAGLPSADALLADRIRGGRIDRGAVEFVPAAGTGNTLDLAGPWRRPASANVLQFTVRGTPAQAGHPFLLAVSGSGTGPALAVAAGMPLVPDALSATLLAIPEWSLGVLGPGGQGSIDLALPPAVVPFLPEMTFVAAVDVLPPPTNPVVVRFLP